MKINENTINKIIKTAIQNALNKLEEQSPLQKQETEPAKGGVTAGLEQGNKAYWDAKKQSPLQKQETEPAKGGVTAGLEQGNKAYWDAKKGGSTKGQSPQGSGKLVVGSELKSDVEKKGVKDIMKKAPRNTRLMQSDGVTFPKRDDALEEQSAGFHACAAHVKENATGREGRPINHTLLEDGTVSHYTVEFENEIVEGIPSGELTVLEENVHLHGKRDDKKHDKKKKRVKHEENLEDEQVLKEWYDNSLYGKLIKEYTGKTDD